MVMVIGMVKKIESSKASSEEQAEMQRMIDEITGGK
jgi:hypothetical protein